MGDDPTQPDELTGTILLLLEEIDNALASDHWAFLRTWQVLPKAYAGAALRHSASLLREMDAARLERRETTVRVLARAHWETWLVGMYLACGAEEALDKLAADYSDSMEKWNRQLTAYNAKILREAQEAEQKNANIRADDKGKKRWNELNPHQPPRPPLPEVPVPTRVPVEFDIDHALKGSQTDVRSKPMSLSEVAHRVDELLEAAGDNLTAEAAYEVVYRSLSTFVTHATLPLLDSYLPQDGGHYIRVARQAGTAEAAPGLTRNSLMLTATLARRTLAMNDTAATIATAIESIATGQGQSPESGVKES